MKLRPKDKDLLLKIFRQVEEPIEVWAFGSRVNGDAHDGSDLDLVVRSKDLQKLPLEVYMDLKNRIRESNIPIVVELLDWGRIPERFKSMIEKKYEVLLGLGIDSNPNP
jgi:predicted nucleotidyltransferase